jgi:hypothetical protein
MQAWFGASPSRRLGIERENRLVCGRSLRPPADGHGQRGEDAQRREAGFFLWALDDPHRKIAVASPCAT